MGKITGFLEYQRLQEAHEAPGARKNTIASSFII